MKIGKYIPLGEYYNVKIGYGIVDLDIRTKGIKVEKRSFMNLEITLFVETQFDIKTKEIKNVIKKLISGIIDDSLTNKNLYNFHKTKK